MDITTLTSLAGTLCYLALAVVAVWGAFCVIVAWRRVGQTRFKSEEDQQAFMGRFDEMFSAGDLDGATELAGEDRRALPQLMAMALKHRDIGYDKLRQLVVDRFRRDVLGDLEHRLNWVNTVIKTAPMLGLLGTVVGMMGAFSKLATGDKVDPTQLADDISVALLTTFLGLSIAIPLVMCTASINQRIRQLEDLVGIGLTQFFEAFRQTSAGAASTRE